MVYPKLLAPLAALGVVVLAHSATSAASGPNHTSAATSKPKHATNAPAPSKQEATLYKSQLLWATVDVCNPKDKPDTIGIRGSMPSEGHEGEAIYMRFRVQYQEASRKKWVDIARGADSGFQEVHRAGPASQAGIDFQLVPTSGAVTLRGVVSFQWRRRAHVVYSLTRATTAGHESLAGADPKGFSAATCTIS